MNKHSKKALKIFLIVTAITTTIFIIYSITLSNNTAEKYRLEMASRIEEVYPDFDTKRENFYDLTGIDSVIEAEEKNRNQLFNNFYQSLSLKEQKKVDERINDGMDNIYGSIDMINSKLAELIDMFETASNEEIAIFQDDFQTKSEALTKNIESIYSELLNQE